MTTPTPPTPPTSTLPEGLDQMVEALDRLGVSPSQYARRELTARELRAYDVACYTLRGERRAAEAAALRAYRVETAAVQGRYARLILAAEARAANAAAYERYAAARAAARATYRLATARVLHGILAERT